jgi:hypothetical protein
MPRARGAPSWGVRGVPDKVASHAIVDAKVAHHAAAIEYHPTAGLNRITQAVFSIRLGMFLRGRSPVANYYFRLAHFLEAGQTRQTLTYDWYPKRGKFRPSSAAEQSFSNTQKHGRR